MGMKDAITKEYLRQNVIFADVFNYALYEGEQEIDANQLIDKDVSEISLPFGEDGEVIPVQKYRDLLKGYVAKEYQGNLLIILGVENQSEVHYAMPVKCMLYDALNYATQVDEKRKEYREKRSDKQKKLKESPAEFLSGFHMNDKLIPVITVTVYWGTEEWDGPRSLRGMLKMDMINHHPEILRWIPDYQIPLITPGEIEHFEWFKTEFGKTMNFISKSKDKEKMKQLLTDVDYRTFSKTAAKIIKEFAGLEIEIDEGKELVDVCKAWEEQKEDGIRIGEQKGAERINQLIVKLADLGRSEDIVKAAKDAEYQKKLIEEFGL